LTDQKIDDEPETLSEAEVSERARSLVERIESSTKQTRARIKGYGQGSVYKVGRLYYFKCYSKGKPSYIPLKTEDEREAYSRAREYRKQLRTGDAHPSQRSLTVGTCLDEYLASQGAEEKGDRFVPIVARLRERFGKMKALKITRQLVNEYVIELRSEGHTEAAGYKRKDGREGKALSKATVNDYLACLRQALALAYETRNMAHALLKFPKLKTGDNVRQGFLEVAQWDALLPNIRVISERLALFFEWFWLIGMRPGTIAALKWTHLRMQNDQKWTLYAPGYILKNGEPYGLDLVKGTPERAVLEAALATRHADSPLIFWDVCKRSHKGRRIGQPIAVTNTAWDRVFERAAALTPEMRREEGEPEWIAYDLRRSSVINLIESGVSESDAMLISGHKTLAMLRRYNVKNRRSTVKALAKRTVYLDKVRRGEIIEDED